MKAKLYLIPTPITAYDSPTVTPALYNRDVVDSIDYFVVENVRSARRLLARLKLSRTIDELTFVELNEHTPSIDVDAMLVPLIQQGRNIGIMSEAGLPCIADPGALLVAAAHRHGVEVVPLVGPSSITLALMASGANGQSFAFNGYLPIRQPERNKAIRQFEARARAEGQSQIFIEAPYRNAKLFEDILSTCSASTMLCVAADILEESQYIASHSVAQWKSIQRRDINKRPAIFIISCF